MLLKARASSCSAFGDAMTHKELLNKAATRKLEVERADSLKAENSSLEMLLKDRVEEPEIVEEVGRLVCSQLSS